MNVDSADRSFGLQHFFFFFWLHRVFVAVHRIFVVARGLVALWHVLPGKSHGERSLAGYSPWGRKSRI